MLEVKAIVAHSDKEEQGSRTCWAGSPEFMTKAIARLDAFHVNHSALSCFADQDRRALDVLQDGGKKEITCLIEAVYHLRNSIGAIGVQRTSFAL